jgi:hypothetical protein
MSEKDENEGFCDFVVAPSTFWNFSNVLMGVSESLYRIDISVSQRENVVVCVGG